MINKLGYCCINQTLRNVKPAKNSIYCSRSIQKKTFNIHKASEYALQNCKDLLTILKWNVKNNIFVFRISSDLFPRFTCNECGYKFEDLKDYIEIQNVLKECGNYAYDKNIHLSFHPGPFTTLGSPNESARQNGIKEVEYHALIVSLLDPYCRLDIPINIHVGGNYGGDYGYTAMRFIRSWKSISNLARGCLVIENDDKPNGWSVSLINNLIYEKIGIPITFDIHHHHFCPGDLTTKEAFCVCQTTWGDRSMQVHYSQSPTDEKFIPKHSDYYRTPIPDFITCENVHIHLESKQKELALLKYRKDFL